MRVYEIAFARQEIQDVLGKYIPLLKNHSPLFKSAILFGSQARGEATIRSDIDIAIVMNDSSPLTPRQRGDLIELSDDIDTTISINLFFTSTSLLDNAESIFDTNFHIKKEGVLLWQP